MGIGRAAGREAGLEQEDTWTDHTWWALQGEVGHFPNMSGSIQGSPPFAFCL